MLQAIENIPATKAQRPAPYTIRRVIVQSGAVEDGRWRGRREKFSDAALRRGDAVVAVVQCGGTLGVGF